jgi:hypothetical protein
VWILAVVLGPLLFFVVLLAVPVDLVFYIEKDMAFSSKVRVGWMFNLVGKEIGGKKREKKEPRKEKKKRKRRIKPLIAMLRARGFLGRLVSFVRDVLRISHIRELRADIRVGLNDPAETGMLFAIVAPVMAYLRAFTSLDVRIQPEFEQMVFQGYFKGDLRIFPIQLLVASILFALSPATMRGIKAMVVARRK